MKVQRKVSITFTEDNVKEMISELLDMEKENLNIKLAIPDPRTEIQGFSIVAEFQDEGGL